MSFASGWTKLIHAENLSSGNEEPTASSGVDVGTRSISDYTLPMVGPEYEYDNRSSEYEDECLL